MLVDGNEVIHDEMNRTSATSQSTAFTVALPRTAFTEFAENTALQGGGGAIFWEDVEPKNLELYRNKSGSNEAGYGLYVATPIRTLSARRNSYNAVSGASMGEDPITLDLRDE